MTSETLCVIFIVPYLPAGMADLSGKEDFDRAYHTGQKLIIYQDS
ncbi:hypothetical protein HMPREF0484_3770 [Klebsiella pneumoniae subsp. rhinoscleromatis ATCC 13884]|jgi:hypothetical protein|nr:hypothetical protein HMPREF0484_3770 [Klebsiella pneumoniae subsp. rhinoscleromatis ATCC 13884]EOZ36202.1 hypothetical protein H246_2237 [Klebsiella pneumoniae VAKPC269]EOZ37030.1 hypothetical protein H248_1304 [Klebsiella pneumoniae VAKPC280]EOZ98064.1 hypothetical protein J054_1903 [Klebsiella pneumoniae 646_1568]EPN91876.1 hypothetical protein H209_2488 [Klebsiella pneumoniae UHKPC28]EPO90886.1 hypothetical protein J047_07598 [Klebsiella pneumoniae 160_1080]DAL48074.1 MAG TPA_asm: hypot